MPAVQDTFDNQYATGFPGMVANGETSNRISLTNEDATPIPFGAPVFAGSAPHLCSADPAAGDFLGFAIADHGVVTLPGGTVDSYAQHKTVPVMQAGVIWVTANEAIAARDGISTLDADGTIVASATAASTATGFIALDAAAADGDLIRAAKRI